MWRQSPQFDRGSIRFRLFRLVVVVSSAAMIISTVGGALFTWNKQQEQVKKSLETIARAAGVAASAALAFNDATAAGEALRILAAQKEIEAAALYPLDGKYLASYGDTTGLPGNVERLREHPPGFSLFSPTTTIFQPILLDDSLIGHVLISASLRDYRDSFLLQAALAIGVNLLGLLLVLFLGLRFLDGIVKPIKDLAETSRQIRDDKDFSRRAAASIASAPRDEISELIANFNAMLAEIEQRECELSDYHKSLERMVAERTEALSAANLELQTAKLAAEAATVVKSRFLAAASHDLRQPILAINLFKDALNKTPLDEEQKRIGNSLSRSIQSLGDLLDALLDISKLDAGAILPTPAPIGIHELFSSIDAEFATMASAKSLRFKLQFPFGDLALLVDSQLLRSLLRNLIGNAIKYTEHGGVLVAIRRRGNQAIMQIWDTGIGIGPEHLDTIFDEYFQVANPERDRAKGLGLGLAIAKRLAKLLDTSIVCRSQLGRGSVFEFRLPLAEAPSKTTLGRIEDLAGREADAATLVGCHIVVIEDDTMVARAIQESMELLGIGITIYSSAEEALAQAEIASADFYVADFRLTGANGVELLDAIQRLATRRIQAILLTGDTSSEAAEIMHSSDWPVLFKPIDLPTLLSAIASQKVEPCVTTRLPVDGLRLKAR